MLRESLPITIQLETSPGLLKGFGAIDLSDLQVARALQRPLISTDVESDYSIANLDTTDKNGRLWLRLKPGARWQDGGIICPVEWKASVLYQMQRTGLMPALLGVTINPLEGGLIELEMTVESTYLRPYLASLPWYSGTKSDVMPKYSGDFIPVQMSSTVIDFSHKSRPDMTVLRYLVESNSKRVKQLFDASIVNLTSPGAFDLAISEAAHPAFVDVEPSIHVALVFNPRRATSLCDPVLRHALLDLIQVPPHLQSLLHKEDWPLPELDHAPDISNFSQSLRLLFGEYTPNKEIAISITDGLKLLGFNRIETKGLSLDNLVKRFSSGDFDLALVLIVDSYDPQFSMLLKMMTAAMGQVHNKDERKRMLARYRLALSEQNNPERNIRIYSDLLARVPIMPLFRFKSGYLSTSGAEIPPLIGGSVFAVETLFDN